MNDIAIRLPANAIGQDNSVGDIHKMDTSGCRWIVVGSHTE
jgi:hypothetical protein